MSFSLYLIFLPKLFSFSLVFSLGPCPNGPVTCSSYSLRSVTRYMRRGVKSWFLHLNLKTTTVLCNIVTVGGERKHVNARVVELRVALLLREGQTLDKERDIRDVRSDTCVINSGLAQVEPIRVFCSTWPWEVAISLVCKCWLSMLGANLTLLQNGHAVGTS